MEPWMIAILIPLLGGIVGYLVVTQHNQGKDMVSLKSDVAYVKQSMSEIMKWQERMDMKVNTFLKNELDTLKEIAMFRHKDM